MSQKVVIIGGGLSSKHAAEILVKAKGLEVTVVQANRFVEWPLAMSVVLVKPALHGKALGTDPDKFQVSGAKYKYGVVENVDLAGKKVVLSTKEALEYDALIVATGFKMPLVYPSLGSSVSDRMTEVQQIGAAIQRARCVVIGGGGPVGLELAGNVRGEYPDKKIVLLCTTGHVLTQWPEPRRLQVEAQLKKMNIEIIKGSGPPEARLEPGVLEEMNGLAYDVYLPAFAQGPNTQFLQSSDLLDSKGAIRVNEFLQSEAYSEIFAVGVTNLEEPTIMPKLEGQWTSVTTNVRSMLTGKPMKKHKEAAPFMKLPAMVLIGHGPSGYGFLDFSNLPPPMKCCCCCGYAGFPCCPPCWPCCACAGFGCCPCGYCCGPPEGKGPATFSGKMAFESAGFHFKGIGAAPEQQRM